MGDSRPIGVFDSGLGGLSVLAEIRRALPAEHLLYFADSGNAPYGRKTESFIQERSAAIASFLLSHDAKALVVACNTATAAAAPQLRARWPSVPIIAMEPAVKPATAATRRGVVGVLATVGTLSSARFAALLDTFGKDVETVTRPGVGLVEFVERGELDTPDVKACLAAHLEPLLAAGADVIVLGCTHYVFLRDQVQAIVGPDVAVIDTGAAVARHLERRLAEAGLLVRSGERGSARFFASGDLSRVAASASLLWREAGLPVEPSPI